MSTNKSMHRPVVMAVVLGTALTAYSASPSQVEANIQPADIQNITRYCNVCWRNAKLPTDRWEDCTQEVYCRLLERIPMQNWSQVFQQTGEEKQELIRAIDTVKKRVQRERKTKELVPEITVQKFETISNEVREEITHAVQENLSPRQQQILQLTMEGWEIADIAQKMEVSPERVSDEKYKGIQKLRSYFRSSEKMTA